jgi:hypothetical protein
MFMDALTLSSRAKSSGKCRAFRAYRDPRRIAVNRCVDFTEFLQEEPYQSNRVGIERLRDAPEFQQVPPTLPEQKNSGSTQPQCKPRRHGSLSAP